MIEFQDATAMAQTVQEKKLSPIELVEASIAKIEALNPQLNAVVSKQYDQARALARQGVFAGKPFGGVPILLKDLGQEQVGQPSTAGAKLLAKSVATQTSNYTRRLEELGFIVLGRTNTPEFGFKNISDSQLHGAVNLLLDRTRNAGGSSGGSAAAVASGMVPLAGASDGGGSIRIPASFNGLIGLKTSRGRIPVGPGSYRGWQGASVNFALTRSVRDTRQLLYHFQDYQLESPFVLPPLTKAQLFDQTLNRRLKIAVLEQSPIGHPISASASEAVRQAADFLTDQGHEVVNLSQHPLDGIRAMQTYYIVTGVETAAMFDGIEASLGRTVGIDDMELMSWALYQFGKNVPASTFSQTLTEWDNFAADMVSFHQTYDLILAPTTADVAPKHGQFALSDDFLDKLRHSAEFSMTEQQDLVWDMYAESLDWTPFTQQANLTGQPAISLPSYQTAEGFPIGIQLTANKGREDLLLQVADVFERENRTISLPPIVF